MSSLPASHTDPTTDSAWKLLYRVAAIGAVIEVLCIAIAIIVFMGWKPPTTVLDWFTFMQNNRLIAMIDFDLLIIVAYIAAIPTTIALYVTLHRVNESLMALAFGAYMIATATYFASNPSFAMSALSDQYAAATTEIQRTALLAAGQAMLATYTGTNFYVANFVGGLSLLGFSIVMLQSHVFSKTTAMVGIVANVVGFALFFPPAGIYISIISVIGLAVWYALIAVKFFQLSRAAPVAGSVT